MLTRNQKIDKSRWWYFTWRIGIATGEHYSYWPMTILSFCLHPMLFPSTIRKCTRCNQTFSLSYWRAWPIINRYILCHCGNKTRQLNRQELDNLFTFALYNIKGE